MTSTPVLSGTLAVAVIPFGPMTPPVGVTTVQLVLDRVSLALLTNPIDMALELSTDAGITWASWGGCTVPAGTVLTGSGVGTLSNITLTESLMEVKIPSADANTRLRGSVTTREIVPTTITMRTS